MHQIPTPYSEKITVAERKLIRSMARSKVRRETGCFLVEGAKAIAECLASFTCKTIVMTDEGYQELQRVYPHEATKPLSVVLSLAEQRIVLPRGYDFSSLSLLQSPRPIVALFQLPPQKKTNLIVPSRLTLLLDGVQDPGNVGSIIRTADWFGISTLLISQEGADPFSPKVVQASMGGIAHLSIAILTKEEILEHLTFYRERSIPILGTFLEGENIFHPHTALPSLSSPSILALGNEGQGISREVSPLCTRRLTIPSLSPQAHGESLNVAVATAISLTALAL